MVLNRIFGGGKKQDPGKSVKKAEAKALPLWSRDIGGNVYSVSISADGEYIAAGSDNKKVYLFDRSGKLLWSYEIGGWVRSVSLSADGGYVAAGSDNKKVYLFDRSGKLLWSYRTGGWVRSVSISSDGRYVAGGSGNNIYLFDRSGRLLWSYRTGGYVHSVSLSADGEYVAVGSDDKKVYLFNRSGKLLWSYWTSGDVDSVSISADGEYIAAGSDDNKVYLFDRSGELLWSYETGNDVHSVSLSADGEYVAVGSDDKKVYLFNRSGKLLWSYWTSGDVDSVSISADGEYIAAGSDDNKVYLFDRSGELLWSYETGDWVRSVSITPDGGYVATGSWDKKVYLFILFGDRQALLSEINALIEEAKKLGISVPSRGNIDVLIERGEPVKAISEAKKLKAELKSLIESRKQAISELKTLESEIEALSSKALKLGISVPSSSNIETLSKSKEYERALEEARKLKQELEEAISKAKPELAPSLDTTTFKLRAGTRTKLTLKNTGSTSAEDIKLEVAGDDFLGDKALVWRIISTPERIEPGDSKPVELWLRFTEEGDLPLSFVVKYKDALGREYEHEQEVWVTVSSGLEAPTPQPTVRTFSNALEERYELLEFIGEGGFAEVWKARRREDGREVALKLPRALTEEGRRVFLQELGVWRLLSGSRHVVELYDCDILSWRGRQQPCIEMELGECSLRRRLPMSVERACRVMFDVGEALAFAHRRGILHRDIKPENIIFVKGVPKLTDFGLAKLKTSRYSRTPKGGTVWYSAPEQFSSSFGGVGEHTDVYQLGVVFYELLTGELPYDAEEEGGYMHAVLYEEPRPLRELKPEVPEQVESIVMRCLEKQPERRYKNAGELREAIAEYLGAEYSRMLSKSGKDVRSSVFYCGELIVFHLREARNTGDYAKMRDHLKEAYKFATDFLHKYCPSGFKEKMQKICERIKWGYEEDPSLHRAPGISDEFLAEVENVVHKIRLGVREM